MEFREKLMSTTAMERALRFVFEVSVERFESWEMALTGRILKENPLPYIH